MFKKKNKNLHRALVALMVLGLLVCLCFTFASAASQPDSSSAAETAPWRIRVRSPIRKQ